MKERILFSPGRYIQGPGVWKRMGEYAARYGSKALVLMTPTGYERNAGRVEEGFAGQEIGYYVEYFRGECTDKEIDRLASLIRDRSFDVVLAVGGGKVLDAAKAAALPGGYPLLICPTSAATDAPCSAQTIVYTEEGVVDRCINHLRSPEMVIVDSEVIAESPIRLTVAGMGDALSTYIEARDCWRAGAVNVPGGRQTQTAKAAAKLCFDTLMEDGLKAKLALEAGALTEAVENIIEANTYLSGVGFESNGCAAAHALHCGLSVLPECHEYYHGERVAFGTLFEMVMNNEPGEELDRVYTWCIDVGLPVTLEEIGITGGIDAKLSAAAERACREDAGMTNMPYEVTPETVVRAMKAADRLGHYYRENG